MSTQTLTRLLWLSFERGCFLGWMVLMTANTIIFGLACELFVFGTALAHGSFVLINETNVPLLFYGVLAAVGFPLISRLWHYGVDHLNFLVHESAFNKMVEPPQAWSDGIMVLLDDYKTTSEELVMLVRLIEEAPGAVERQDRRAEARLWLINNRDKLSEENLEFAKQNLGYLRY